MLRFIMSSLRNKVVVIVLIALVIPLTMANFYFVSGMKNILRQNMESQARMMSSQAAYSINGVITNMLNISNIVSLDKKTDKALSYANSDDAYEVLTARNDLENILKNVSNGLLSYKYRFNIIIISNDKVMATSINDIEQDYFILREAKIYESISADEWFTRQRNDKAILEWVISHTNYVNPNSSKCISLVRSINSNTSNKILGYLIISISTKEIANILEQFMTDYNGIIMIE